MKLIRFGNKGEEKPGVLINHNERKDLSAYFYDWDRNFFEGRGLDRLRGVLQTHFENLPNVNPADRWASCVPRPGKIICIGLNYTDHALESGMAIPLEPIVFQKAANTVVGPFDPIVIPRGSKKTDWEVELGVVISREARYLSSEEEASDYIGGYCISHDVSERAFQMERGGQWTKGKSCDNFNPLGPFLATSDELGDIYNLDMSLLVNGEQMQNGNSGNMIFNCNYLIHYLSQFMTLEAGDLISTGTPAGVGFGMQPARYLKAGDRVTVEIAGLGRQEQICVPA